MGEVRIVLTGSFAGRPAKRFGAMQHGHAHAIAQAIAWLSSEVLPKAIAQDHALHEEGHHPEGGFDRTDVEGGGK